MTCVSTGEQYLVAEVNQKAARWIEEGDEAEVALSLYLGRVFPAVVERVIWARGRAQLTPSGQLPELRSIAALAQERSEPGPETDTRAEAP